MTTAFTVVEPTSIPITRSVTDTGVSLPPRAAENQAFQPFWCGDTNVSGGNHEKNAAVRPKRPGALALHAPADWKDFWVFGHCGEPFRLFDRPRGLFAAAR